MAKAAIDPDRIKDGLHTRRAGRQVIVYKSTSSTNDIAWEYGRNRKNDGVAVFAEHQSAGRGRGANKWLSEAGESVLCSILVLDCGVEAELMTLAAGVAVCEAIGRCGKKRAKLKWPNDVIVGGKKIAGILLESKQGRKGKDFVVGVGINCHQTAESFGEGLREIATSIDMETGAECDRIEAAKKLLESVEQWIEIAENDSEKVIERWRELSEQLGQRVMLRHNNKTYSGNCIGVDPTRGLILQIEGGGVRMFDAAHTSIVKGT